MVEIHIVSPGVEYYHHHHHHNVHFLYHRHDITIIITSISIGNSMICSDIWHKYHE